MTNYILIPFLLVVLILLCTILKELFAQRAMVDQRIHNGRKPHLTKGQRQRLMVAMSNPDRNLDNLSKEFNVCRSSLYRYVERSNTEQRKKRRKS